MAEEDEESQRDARDDVMIMKQAIVPNFSRRVYGPKLEDTWKCPYVLKHCEILDHLSLVVTAFVLPQLLYCKCIEILCRHISPRPTMASLSILILSIFIYSGFRKGCR